MIKTNPYVLIPLVTWAMAQALKFTISAVRGNLEFKYLYASGGMPSVHSAVVVALATTAALKAGTDSPIFGVAVIFAAIVMYDSFGVRRASGEQAAAINMLIGSLGRDRVRLTQPEMRAREILGHKPLEVTVGAILGAALAALFSPEQAAPHLAGLKMMPQRTEMIIYAAIFGAVVVAGWITRLVLARRRRGSKALSKLGKAVLIMTQVVGWLGLALGLCQYEKVSYLAWRLWPVLVLIAAGCWVIYLVNRFWSDLPRELAAEAELRERRRWLPGSGKTKKRP